MGCYFMDCELEPYTEKRVGGIYSLRAPDIDYEMNYSVNLLEVYYDSTSDRVTYVHVRSNNGNEGWISIYDYVYDNCDLYSEDAILKNGWPGVS